jgi:hypothetical protein
MKKGRSESAALIGVDRGYATFYEKAQFVKADVAALEIVAERNGCSLPFALCFYPHFR